MAEPGSPVSRIFARLGGWEAFLGLLTLATLSVAAAFVPNFVSEFNISQAIAGVSERALIVLPMTLLIIAREIDLSVASTLALTSVVFGMLVRADVPLALAMPLTLISGVACGAFNGLLVTRLGLPSLVVTLGTLAMFRGIGYILLGAGSVNQFSDAFLNFGVDNVDGTPIPWTIVPFLALAPIFAIVLQKTPAGRRIYAIGGNPDAARYSGINLKRTALSLFIISGLVSSIAGIVFTARLANARADNALGLELDVITIVLLGGISVFGGRGKLTGVLWALILVAAIRNILGLLEIGGDAQGTVIGLLLITSLLVTNAASAVLDRFGAWFMTSRAGE
jgi:rhamnose transport system permease protein